MRKKIYALILGLAIPVVAFCGLETGTYISDLVATNPLGSDLASTIDDHIRLLKSTIKTTFPNINGAVSATDEELSLLAGKTGTVWTSANDGAASTLDADLLDGISSAGFCQTGGSGCPTIASAANPTASVGLSAVNGSAGTYMRSDGAPALSQSIAPTWTAQHTFTKERSGAGEYAILMSSALPTLGWTETDASADNKKWQIVATSEQWGLYTANDSENTNGTIMTVDRTGTTVDRVAFPSEASAAFVVGTLGTIFNTSRMHVRTTNAGSGAAQFISPTATGSTIFVHNEATAGDNIFVTFQTEAGAGGTVRGSIDYNRAGGATRYNTTSDARLKKNFRASPSAKSVIDCIKVESYDWKETGSHVDHGFVAQRLNKCAPYAVKSSDDPSVIWGVDPSKLVPALIKYVQEQDARISRLEADAARRR
jgi:hypothetical protein